MATPEIRTAHAALRDALRHFADDEVVVEHGGWTETRILELGDRRAEHVVTWGCRVRVGERYVDVVIRRTTELDRTTYQFLEPPEEALAARSGRLGPCGGPSPGTRPAGAGVSTVHGPRLSRMQEPPGMTNGGCPRNSLATHHSPCGVRKRT